MLENNQAKPHRLATLPQAFHALSDENRLGIIVLLKSHSLNVHELTEISRLGQSLVSHHLKVLGAAKLTEAHRDGTQIFYRRVAPRSGNESIQDLFKMIDSHPCDNTKEQRSLAAVISKRAERSLRFFKNRLQDNPNAEISLVEYQDYAEVLLSFIEELRRSRRIETITEIGFGRGELLFELAKMVDHVIGIDNCDEILERAREKSNRETITLIQADASETQLPSASCDLVIMNMVLHHVVDPANAFKELRRISKPDGTIILSDLSSHTQDWTREVYGDVWLGFDEKSIEKFAAEGGLKILSNSFYALRNGFQFFVTNLSQLR